MASNENDQEDPREGTSLWNYRNSSLPYSFEKLKAVLERQEAIAEELRSLEASRHEANQLRLWATSSRVVALRRREQLLDEERQLHQQFQEAQLDPTKKQTGSNNQEAVFSALSDLIEKIDQAREDLRVSDELSRHYRHAEVTTQRRIELLKREQIRMRRYAEEVRQEISAALALPHHPTSDSPTTKSNPSGIRALLKRLARVHTPSTPSDYSSRFVRNYLEPQAREGALKAFESGYYAGLSRDLGALRLDQLEINDDAVIALARAMAEERPDLLVGFALAALRGPDSNLLSPRVRASLADVLRSITKEVEQ